MGYKPKRTLYKLDFSETEHVGLEVTTRSMPMAGLVKILQLADQLEDIDAGSADAAATMDALINELLSRFAGVLVDWNVDDDADQPVPATVEGLASQDFGFILAVILAWVSTMSAAPPPLPGASPSGGMTPEESLNLAGSSASLPSSPPPA